MAVKDRPAYLLIAGLVRLNGLIRPAKLRAVEDYRVHLLIAGLVGLNGIIRPVELRAVKTNRVLAATVVRVMDAKIGEFAKL